MGDVSFAQPTTWILEGNGMQVRYSTAEPQLFYQDVNGVRTFSGDEIRVVQGTDAETLVSVTLHITVDSGSTSFTLLLPRVNLPAPPALPAAVPVSTEGITTVHHLSLVPAFQRGQQDTYTVHRLRGAAS